MASLAPGGHLACFRGRRRSSSSANLHSRRFSRVRRAHPRGWPDRLHTGRGPTKRMVLRTGRARLSSLADSTIRPRGARTVLDIFELDGHRSTERPARAPDGRSTTMDQYDYSPCRHADLIQFGYRPQFTLAAPVRVVRSRVSRSSRLRPRQSSTTYFSAITTRRTRARAGPADRHRRAGPRSAPSCTRARCRLASRGPVSPTVGVDAHETLMQLVVSA